MSLFTNINSSLKFSNVIFTVFGVWPPPGLSDFARRLYTVYFFLLMFLTIGVYIIIQTGDLVQVWGDLTLMTATVFILFTNIAYVIKLVYVFSKRELIQKIIFDGDEELDGQKTELAIKEVKRYRRNTIRLAIVYCFAAFSSIIGFIICSEKNQLPLRAWYPFDATKRPAYQWTYAHQIIALSIAAAVNVCCDLLVTALIAQCRCRLRLIAESLRTLCDDVDVDKKGRITAEGEAVVISRVRSIVMRHQFVLEQVKQLQQCFSVPILGQFAFASCIMCVTAYQMAFDPNLYRLITLTSYEIAVTMQVFIYCVEGNNLTIDIMKASYTFFTVLQSTGEL